MKAVLFKPSSGLSQYIDNYMLVDIDWDVVQARSSIWRLIPFGQVSMLFLFGDAHEYNLTGPKDPMLKTMPAFMVGQLTRPVWLKFSGHTRLLKIQFKSAGAYQFFPFNMQEFTNVPSLDLEAVWGSAVKELLEQFSEAKTDMQRIDALNIFLEARLRPSSGMVDYVDFTISSLKIHKGNVSICQIEDRLGISSRHLERLFRNKVGLTPKELSKIIRLNCALSQLHQKPDISLSRLSHANGYYDQAHFSRDFKRIAGVAPSRLLAESSAELFVTNGKCFVNQH